MLLQDKTIPNWISIPRVLPKEVINRDISHKTKGILWIVSHCSTESQREEYVKKLRDKLSNLSIDILGSCGNNTLEDDNLIGETFGSRSSSYYYSIE